MTFKDWTPPKIDRMGDYADVLEAIFAIKIFIDASTKPHIGKMIPRDFALAAVEHLNVLRQLAGDFRVHFE